MIVPAFALIFAQYPTQPVPVPRMFAKGFATINAKDAREMVTALAGPDYNGRGPGQPGFDAAAGFAASWFRANGLASAGDKGGYFQRMFLSSSKVDPATAKLTAGAATLEWGNDFVFAITGNLKTELTFAFVKFNGDTDLTVAELDQLKGKVVIVDPESSPRSPGRQTLSRLQNDGRLGAVALVVPAAAALTTPTARFTRTANEPASLSTFRMTRAGVTKLATALGIADWTTGQPGIRVPSGTATLQGSATVTDELSTMNVLAKLEGSDPKLKNEVVAIGSHLDHLGVTERGTYWGADDDASGSTANMLIARAFAQNGVRPRRTVLFCLWTMEEKGLLGSQFYATHPVFPLKDTVAYLNMDMVGRDSDNPDWTDRAKENTDAVYASSAKVGSPELYALVQEANRSVGLNLRDDREDRTMRSDTGSFARYGVPVLKAFTGEHPDYHKMTDTPEKLNYPKMAKVVQWVYLCAQMLATQDGRPGYVATGRYVQGRVNLGAPTELPKEATIEVVLLEDGKPIDRSTLVNTGHVPQIFTLRYDAAKLDQQKKYAIRARIVEKGKMTYSAADVPVLTGGNPVNGVEIRLLPAK